MDLFIDYYNFMYWVICVLNAYNIFLSMKRPYLNNH